MPKLDDKKMSIGPNPSGDDGRLYVLVESEEVGRYGFRQGQVKREFNFDLKSKELMQIGSGIDPDMTEELKVLEKGKGKSKSAEQRIDALHNIAVKIGGMAQVGEAGDIRGINNPLQQLYLNQVKAFIDSHTTDGEREQFDAQMKGIVHENMSLYEGRFEELQNPIIDTGVAARAQHSLDADFKANTVMMTMLTQESRADICNEHTPKLATMVAQKQEEWEARGTQGNVDPSLFLAQMEGHFSEAAQTLQEIPKHDARLVSCARQASKHSNGKVSIDQAVSHLNNTLMRDFVSEQVDSPNSYNYTPYSLNLAQMDAKYALQTTEAAFGLQENELHPKYQGAKSKPNLQYTDDKKERIEDIRIASDEAREEAREQALNRQSGQTPTQEMQGVDSQQTAWTKANTSKVRFSEQDMQSLRDSGNALTGKESPQIGRRAPVEKEKSAKALKSVSKDSARDTSSKAPVDKDSTSKPGWTPATKPSGPRGGGFTR